MRACIYKIFGRRKSCKKIKFDFIIGENQYWGMIRKWKVVGNIQFLRNFAAIQDKNK